MAIQYGKMKMVLTKSLKKLIKGRNGHCPSVSMAHADEGQDTINEVETMNAKLYGNIAQARAYDKSAPEIEWTCCPNVICGHARRIGLDRSTGLAVYRLSSFRHANLTGASVVVGHEGEILLAGSLKPVSPEHSDNCPCRNAHTGVWR